MAQRLRIDDHPPLVAVSTRPTARPRPDLGLGQPRLSVVIVNFCQWKNTAVLTQYLRQSQALRVGDAEIIIVDNHSADDITKRRLSKHTGVTIHENEANEGFARAVNRGTELGRGDWILLLNPDCTVAAGFLDRVLECAERTIEHDSRVGVVGFQLRNPDGSLQAGVGQFPTLKRTLWGLCSPRSRRKCQVLAGDIRREVSWVTGGCLLVRRECYEALQGLDEQFFLYYEDVDFCQRAQKQGWSVWYDPSVEVTHHWPLHVRSVPPALRLVTRHALLTYAKKHWNKLPAAVLHGIVWLEAWTREQRARWKSDADAADCFRELRRLVGDLYHDRADAVADRIQHAATLLHEAAAAQDGQTS